MINQDSLQNTYKRYAKIYDLTFGMIINPGRKKVIEKLQCKPHQKILEVGVGTGLALPLYPIERDHLEITGIDLSEDMLAIALKRVEEKNLKNVKLLQMNAEAMTFEDNQFDKVVALYVASVVPNPDQLIAEMMRVCKPDGELFIVNHFYSSNRFIAFCEDLINPILAKLFGFQPCVRLDQFIEHTGIEVIEQSKVNVLGNWTFLKVKNTKSTNVDQETQVSGQQASDMLQSFEL